MNIKSVLLVKAAIALSLLLLVVPAHADQTPIHEQAMQIAQEYVLADTSSSLPGAVPRLLQTSMVKKQCASGGVFFTMRQYVLRLP